MRLIALCGPAGSGKDTIADHLCEAHGFVRYASFRNLSTNPSQRIGLAGSPRG